MNKAIIIILILSIAYTANAAAGCASSTAGDGIYTCSAAAVVGVCMLGHRRSADNACVGCEANTGNAAGDPSLTVSGTTACPACPAGNTCAAVTTATSAGVVGTSNIVPCTAGNYCAGGTAAAVACPAGFFCPTGAKEPTPCGEGKYSAASGSVEATHCLSPTAGFTPIAGCKVYANVGATLCAINKEGFVTIAVGSTTGPVGTTASLGVCVPNCKTCTANATAGTPLPAECSAALPGWVQKVDGTTHSIVACSADKSCATCTIGNATPFKIDCTSAAAGYLLTGTALERTAVRTPPTFGSPAGNVLAAGLPCNTAKNCGNCFDVDTCETCSTSKNYVFAAGVCTELVIAAGASINVTCDQAAAVSSDTMCTKCALNRFLMDATDITKMAPNGVGKCYPSKGYYETSPPTATPMKCGENVAECTASGVVSCAATPVGLIKAPAVNPTLCVLITDTPAGYLKNAAGTNFDKCDKTCQKCAGTATMCTSCVTTGFIAPTSSSPDYATQLSKLVPDATTGVCSNSCNSTAVPNANRDACVLSTSNSSILSIVLLAIIALLL